MAAPRYVDLHLHTTASDGVCAPSELIRLAAGRRLSAVAVTDHDTVEGLAEAAATAKDVGLELIPGIELGTSHTRGTMHMLGYFIDPQSASLRRSLDQIRAWRRERNDAIVARLGELGITLPPDWAAGFSAEQAVGRPHLAEELVRLGIVTGLQQAFTRFLGSSGAAYVRRKTLTPEQAISVIREAGGVAGLAHPALLEYESRLELTTLLHRLRDAGLRALEVHHPSHNTVQSRLYVELGTRLKLAPTGGSDLHDPRGTACYRIGFSGIRVPYGFLDHLRRLASGRRRHLSLLHSPPDSSTDWGDAHNSVT